MLSRFTIPLRDVVVSAAGSSLANPLNTSPEINDIKLALRYSFMLDFNLEERAPRHHRHHRTRSQRLLVSDEGVAGRLRTEWQFLQRQQKVPTGRSHFHLKLLVLNKDTIATLTHCRLGNESPTKTTFSWCFIEYTSRCWLAAAEGIRTGVAFEWVRRTIGFGALLLLFALLLLGFRRP